MTELPDHPDFTSEQNAKARRAAREAAALIEDGEFAAAAEMLETALVELPDHPALALPYTRALLSLERFDEAGPAALVCARLCSLEPETYELLALALRADGQPDLAAPMEEYAKNLENELAARPPAHAMDSFTRGIHIFEHNSKRPSDPKAPDADGAPILISTELWGGWHLEMFINLLLPSLLAENNIPWAGDHRPGTALMVSLPFEEYLILRQDPTFQQAAQHIDIHVFVIKHPPTWRADFLKYRTMSILQNSAIQWAVRHGAVYFPLPPDTVQADGTVRAALRVLEEEDKRAFFAWSPRIELEEFMRYLELHGEGASVQDLVKSRRNLVHVAMATQHRVQRAMNTATDTHSTWPSSIVWTVPGQGYAVRAFHLAPVAIRPDGLEIAGRITKTIDAGYVPSEREDLSDLYVSRDSDEYFGFSVSGRDDDTVVNTNPMWFSRENILSWWRQYNTDLDDFHLSHPIRIHSVDIDEGLWTDAEAAADELVDWLKAER